MNDDTNLYKPSTPREKQLAELKAWGNTLSKLGTLTLMATIVEIALGQLLGFLVCFAASIVIALAILVLAGKATMLVGEDQD